MRIVACTNKLLIATQATGAWQAMICLCRCLCHAASTVYAAGRAKMMPHLLHVLHRLGQQGSGEQWASLHVELQHKPSEPLHQQGRAVCI